MTSLQKRLQDATLLKTDPRTLENLCAEAATLLDQAKEALIDASDFICASIYADSASAEPTLIKINAALAALNGTPVASSEDQQQSKEK